MQFKIIKIKKSEFNKKRKTILENIIQELFDFARKNKDKEILQKIGKHIWKLKTHFKVDLKDNKRFICRKCKTVLIPGINMKVRNYNHYMIYECMNCHTKRRFKLHSKSVKPLK